MNKNSFKWLSKPDPANLRNKKNVHLPLYSFPKEGYKISIYTFNIENVFNDNFLELRNNVDFPEEYKYRYIIHTSNNSSLIDEFYGICHVDGLIILSSGGIKLDTIEKFHPIKVSDVIDDYTKKRLK